MRLQGNQTSYVTWPAPQSLRTETEKPHQLGVPERFFIEKTLMQMYPRLQRQDLFPWKLLAGPLIPDFIVKNTSPQTRRIVEIGCGDGLMSNILSLLFPHIEVIGIDTNADLIEAARQTVGYRQNLKFVCGNPSIMVDIPCDRIIYSNCLSRFKSPQAFQKLLIKTLGWAVAEGDFIVRESLPKLIHPDLVKAYWPRLKNKQTLPSCLKATLGEIGHPNSIMYTYGNLPGMPTELYLHNTTSLKLSGMMAPAERIQTAEWHDEEEQSADSVVGFLFARQEADFTRALS